MYTVEFISSNGQSNIIKNVNEIEIGDTWDELNKIPSDEIMTQILPTRGFYRMTGPTVNATYFADTSIICVSVKKG